MGVSHMLAAFGTTCQFSKSHNVALDYAELNYDEGADAIFTTYVGLQHCGMSAEITLCIEEDAPLHHSYSPPSCSYPLSKHPRDGVKH